MIPIHISKKILTKKPIGFDWVLEITMDWPTPVNTRTRNKYNEDKCRNLHFLYAVGKRKNDTLWNVPVKIKNHQFMRKSHQGGTIS